MAIPVFLTTAAINRLIGEIRDAGFLPSVEGKIGRSPYLHACYKVSVTSLPLVATEEGTLMIHAPIAGTLSIPWGLGVDFIADAVATLTVDILDQRLEIAIDAVYFRDLRVGKGCSLPSEIQEILAQAVRGAIISLLGGDGRLGLDLFPLEAPLFSLIPEAPPIEMRIKDIVLTEGGLAVMLGLAGEEGIPEVTSMPPKERDLSLVITEKDAERLLSSALKGPGGAIAGNMSIAVPDPLLVMDLFQASGETLTSFGRRGLGRRKLQGNTRVNVDYMVTTGDPNVRIQEDGLIVIHDVPAHITGKAVLEMDVPRNAGLKQYLTMFLPASRRKPVTHETVTVKQWDLDQDFRIKHVDARLSSAGDTPKWEVTKIDVDLDLGWALPSAVMEEIVEVISKRIASTRIPRDIPEVFDLPVHIPFNLRLKAMEFLTTEGKLFVQANVALVPKGDLDQTRAQIGELVHRLMPPMIIGQPEVSWK